MLVLPRPRANIAAMLTVGRSAPSFSLPDQDGRSVSLRGLRGRWVVLYFYPKDDTPGCTVEACEFTARLPDFSALDAVVLGCSADGAAAHTKFIAKHRLGITLLTGADRKVMQAYGAFGEKKLYGKPVVGVIRSTVLITPDGKVAHHWATVRAAGHAEQVHARLAELQGGVPAVATPKGARMPAKKSAEKPRKRVAAKAAKKAPGRKKSKAAATAKKTAKK